MSNTLTELLNTCFEKKWSLDDDDARLQHRKIPIKDRRTLAGQLLYKLIEKIYMKVKSKK